MHTHLSFKTQLRMSSLTIIPFTLLQMYHSSFALLNNTLQKKKTSYQDVLLQFIYILPLTMNSMTKIIFLSLQHHPAQGPVKLK